MDWRAYLRHFDYLLIAATLALIGYGVMMIYFATRHDIDGQPLHFVIQQLVAVGVGLAAAVVISLLDYEIYRRFQWVMYAFAVFILVIVLPFVVVTRGEVDHRDAVGDEPERGDDEEVVEMPQVGAPVHAQSLLTAPVTFSLSILNRAS